MEVSFTGEVVMTVVPRGSDKRSPSKSILWLAGILIVAPIGCLCVRPQSVSGASPAQAPGASSSTAGITVTGIAGGSVRVAVVEVDGQSFVVGVGDRIRDFTVKAISATEVVLGRGKQTFRLPLARAGTTQTAAVAAPPAVAIPAAAPATPAAPSVVPSPPPAEPRTFAPPLAQPPTVPVRSVESGPTGYPQQGAIPVWVVPLATEPPNPSALPPGTTLYTPSGTSIFGFATAPITPQSAVTVRGVLVLPVASNQLQTDTQLLPPGAILYTPSGTSLYGISTPPITVQNTVTIRGATGLPVATNQAQSPAQVLVWPPYRVELDPISDQSRAIAVAVRLAETGFVAKVEAAVPGQYTVTLIPPPQSTVAQGIAAIRSSGADIPFKIDLLR